MATVEDVIEKLKREYSHLEAERDKEISLVELGTKAGGKREVRRLREWYGDRRQVIAYAINFLEEEVEEPCPD